MTQTNHEPKDHFDLEGEDYDNAYKLLADLVVPRPIAWQNPHCIPDRR